ncbi:MAG: alpha/beta hydrolase, partial [Erysipelotrichaceae bacterium]|nr:alpha/beta hydrolase [Erysipelotrichaceae bacterium]
MMKNYFTLSSTIKDVLNDEHLKDFARLLFPIDLNTPEHLTLAEISSSKYFVWYTNIKAEKTVEILNYLKDEVINGH